MRTDTPRFKGEKGLAIIMTGLLLVPLMMFAAFGVDLASWYSRISQIQKAADAAALAGTVWMPNLSKATGEAEASLRSNGFVDGVNGIVIEIDRGSTPTSLRVEVTDTDADRVFSQVFRGQQTLTRHAEAEYNLPIPLGSPLNYFGGDRTRIPTESGTTEYFVQWPGDYTTRVPSNRPCNIGTSAEGLGRWMSNSTFNTGQHTGSAGNGNRLCTWEPTTSVVNTPPANATVLAPINAPCNRLQSPSSSLGRWASGNPPTYTAGTNTSNGRFSGSASSGNRQCEWRVVDPATLPPNYTTSYPPANRACNVPPIGRWPASGGFQANQFYNSGTENRLCAWAADVGSNFIPPPPNPIATDRSPGFWAAIGGPGDVSAFGDAYSARCTGSTNCSGQPNQMYSTEGYWYVIKMPAAGATSTTIRVFDAAYNPNASSTTLTGDTRGTFTSGNGFTTTYRVFRQTNPLDIAQRVPIGSGTANQTPGSCHWALRNEEAFRINWQDLCTINPNNGEIYLLNVKTTGPAGATDGVNGYAVEAVSTGAVQPAVYAFGTMAMRNNIDAGEARFYLAEVGPQYAGKTLVVELFDAGDAQGNAFLRPVSPGTVAGDFTNIASSRCSYTSSPAPNPGIFSGSPAGQQTSPPVTTPTTPALTNCQIQTTASGTQRFNDNWLTIRVDIPSDYTCTLGVNPETTTGSCWWGIKYNFSASSNDVTTWRARIEGNPLQLTQ